MSEVMTLLKVQAPCHKSTSEARTPLNVQSPCRKWLALTSVLAVRRGSSGIISRGESNGVETGDISRAPKSIWFLGSAKPGMSSNIPRPTSWSGMTGSSSGSGSSVVGSSKSDPSRQQGFPTRVMSWAGTRESRDSSEESGCSSQKRDPNVRHGTPFRSGEQVAQGHCRVDSPVTWLIYKIRKLHCRLVSKGHGFPQRIPSVPI